jgi:protein-S-isoprenylcysteine O-methyltransferase Ste14
MELKSRLALRVAIVLPAVAAVMFLPAGSLRFWQGWVFLGIFGVFNAVLLGYFYKRDPKLLARRLQNKEPRREQKAFKVLWVPLWICTLTLPGLDYRFGWSQRLLAPVPVWLSVAAQTALVCSWFMLFEVFRFNTFASTVVQVEEGQRVISDGPYRLVRHPMYSGIALMALAAPLALGSFVALPIAALKIPILIYRLRDEERMLRKELPGYGEYCARTPWRLVPHLY